MTHDQALRALRNSHGRRAALAVAVALGAFPAAVAAALVASRPTALAAAALLLLGVWRAYRSGLEVRATAVVAARHRALRYALARLARDGWLTDERVRWAGAGHIGYVVVARAGVGFVVELTTVDYRDAEVAAVRVKAGWVAHERNLRMGVVPVLCIGDARDVEALDSAVVVCSTDRLSEMLRQQSAQRLHDSVAHVGSAMLPGLPRG